MNLNRSGCITLATLLAAPDASAGPGKKGRVRLFQTDLLIDGDGEVKMPAGRVNVGKLSAATHRFRVKLERGRKRCRKGDISGRVSLVELHLDGEVVARLQAAPGNCWQRRKVYLPDGISPHGKKLLVVARGQKDGLARAWLDAYPRAAGSRAPATRPQPAARPTGIFTIVPQTRITIGALGKVKQTIGPFDVPGVDTARFSYGLQIRIPAAYGKDCDASKPLRPHRVRSIRISLNGKEVARSEPTNECPISFAGGMNIRPRASGNRMVVQASGKAGGWFGVGFTRREK